MSILEIDPQINANENSTEQTMCLNLKLTKMNLKSKTKEKAKQEEIANVSIIIIHYLDANNNIKTTKNRFFRSASF